MKLPTIQRDGKTIYLTRKEAARIASDYRFYRYEYTFNFYWRNYLKTNKKNDLKKRLNSIDASTYGEVIEARCSMLKGEDNNEDMRTQTAFEECERAEKNLRRNVKERLKRREKQNALPH